MADEQFPDDAENAHSGVTVDDLPAIMRELFDQCVADARSVADPHDDFDAFVDQLWDQVAAAFSLVRRDWPADAPAPWPAQVDQQRGMAEALLEGRMSSGDLTG